MVAENGFTSVHAATVTVDVLRQDGGIVQFGPQLCRLFPQCLVIVLRGNVGIALLTVQPADGNMILHLLCHFSDFKVQAGALDGVGADFCVSYGYMCGVLGIGFECLLAFKRAVQHDIGV